MHLQLAPGPSIVDNSPRKPETLAPPPPCAKTIARRLIFQEIVGLPRRRTQLHGLPPCPYPLR
eukprot:6791689-Lingulodinium_polyedra.AAC.1